MTVPVDISSSIQLFFWTCHSQIGGILKLISTSPLSKSCSLYYCHHFPSLGYTTKDKAETETRLLPFFPNIVFLVYSSLAIFLRGGVDTGERLELSLYVLCNTSLK